MGEKGRLSRRDALKATGATLSGLAVSAAGSTPAAAQTTYYRYDAMRIRLVDTESQPPRFLAVRTPVYLTQPLLADCNTTHPCSIDVLAYRRVGDDDDNDGDDDDDDNNDNGDDDNEGDDDDASRCPGYASIVLLCHGQSPSEATVLTGLIPDVLAQFADRGYDYAVRISPSDATNVGNPEAVSSPCPARTDDDSDDQDDDNDDQDDQDDDDDNDELSGPVIG